MVDDDPAGLCYFMPALSLIVILPRVLTMDSRMVVFFLLALPLCLVCASWRLFYYPALHPFSVAPASTLPWKFTGTL